MKKGFLSVAIALWALVLAAVIGLTVYSVHGGFGDMAGTGSLIKNEDIFLGNIQNIVVEASSQAVELRKIAGDKMKVSQYGNPKTRNEKLFLFTVSDDNVHIYFEKKWHFDIFNFNINEKLIIEIPEDFKGNLKAGTSSGGVKSEDGFILNDVKLYSSSGGVRVNGNLTANSLDATTSSGGIHIGNADVQTYYLQSSSGGIKAEGLSGGGEAKTSSGGIQLSLVEPKGDIKLTSSSGGIKVMLEPLLQFTLDARVSSGGIHTNFAAEKSDNGKKATAKVGDNPAANIIARTSSGGIRVEN